MEIDLSLLPFEGTRSVPCSRTVLRCERRPVLFELIAEIETQHGMPVPKGFKRFWCVSDDGAKTYGVSETTPYGRALLAVAAHWLTPFASHREVRDNRQNRAVWAYLEQLQADQLVALGWH